MSFIHGYLLAGLVLVGLPVLIHLMMQQKPQLLAFPAFRFLRQKQHSNRRKIQLQHWLLMALRMLLIAALLLGLARPRLAGSLVPKSWRSWLSAGIDRPVVAVFVFDTSWSMDYRADKQSRLDQAKAVALQLLPDFPETTQLAVLDTGEESAESEWLTTPAQARTRLNQLRLRPVAVPLLRLVEQARKMLELESKAEEAPLPLLYVFSDHTQSSWTGSDGMSWQAGQDGANPIHVGYLDVGIHEPADISIDRIGVEPESVNPGQSFRVSAVIRATGKEFHDQVACQFDRDTDPPLRQKLSLLAGQSKQVSFDLKAPLMAKGNLTPAFPQLTVSLRRDDQHPYEDALPFNNQAYATLKVLPEDRQSTRKLLILAENPADCIVWKAVLAARAQVAPSDSFSVDIRPLQEGELLKPENLDAYKVICLFQAVAPTPRLWDLLQGYVERGGGLGIVPAGKEIDRPELRNRFNEQGSKVLPGLLESLRSVPSGRDPEGVRWTGFDGNHPLLKPFLEWSRNADLDFTQSHLKPFVNRYWRVKPDADGHVIATYADADQSPALLERTIGRGRVLQFTVVQDNRRFDAQGNDIRLDQSSSRPSRPDDRDWLNHWKDSSFGYLLTLKALGYLAGETANQELNSWAGQTVTVALPPNTVAGAAFRLDGDGDLDLSESERQVQATREGADLTPLVLPPLQAAGNFRLVDRQDKVVAAFSLNIRPEESQLDGLSDIAIENVLGPGVIVHPGPDFRLVETLEGNQPAPIELLPLLMILMLLALTFEGSLANWFSRRRANPAIVDGKGIAP